MLDQVVQRIMRMVRFDNSVYREIKVDEEATTQAAVVVLASALLAALGSLIAGSGFIGFIGQLILIPVVSWLLWSYLVQLLGTRFFGGQGSFWEVARVLGYATAPQALGLLAFIPCLGALIGLVAGILSLIIGVIGIRESMEMTTEKAILTAVIAWVVVMIVTVILGLVAFGSMAMTMSIGS